VRVLLPAQPMRFEVHDTASVLAARKTSSLRVPATSITPGWHSLQKEGGQEQ